MSLSPLKQRHKNSPTNRWHERQGTGPLLGPGVGVSCYLKLSDHRTIIKMYVYQGSGNCRGTHTSLATLYVTHNGAQFIGAGCGLANMRNPPYKKKTTRSQGQTYFGGLCTCKKGTHKACSIVDECILAETSEAMTHVSTAHEHTRKQ